MNTATQPQAVATVVSVTGLAFARNADGAVRRLATGDAILQGETVFTLAGGEVELAFADGHTATILASESYLMGPEAMAATSPDAGDAAIAAAGEVGKVAAALEAGGDILEGLEPTAAGPGAGGAENGGNSFVRLLRIAEGVTAVGFGFGANSTADIRAPEGEAVPQQEEEPSVSVGVSVGAGVGETDGPDGEDGPVIITDPGTIPVVSTGSASITEGSGGAYQPLTFVVSLDRPHTEDVTVSYQIQPGSASQGVDYLDGDYAGTVTIPAGALGFTVTVFINPDYAIEGNETFQIVLTDAVGATINPSASTAAVTIIDDDVPPNVTGDARTVYETALADGRNELSDPAPDSDPREVVTGNFTVTTNPGTPDEPYTLTLQGDAGGLVTIGAVGDTVTTTKGVLTITSISGPVDGVVTYGYTYALSDNLTTHTDQGEGTPITDTITMAVTDSTGDADTTPGTIVISIVDDVPAAALDTDTANEGEQNVTGNVLTNDVFGADGPTAAGLGVVGVVAGNTGTALDDSTTLGVAIETTYGFLTLNADGSYDYDAKANITIPPGTQDIFTYTVKDGDGDLHYTTLTITLTDSGLTAANDDEVLVYEKALDTIQDGSDLAASTVTGSLPGNTGETDASNTLTDNVSGGIGTKTYTLNGGAPGSDGGGNYTTLTGTYGVIKLYADGSYIYTLTKPYDTSPDANDGANTEDNRDNFAYTVTDANGNTATATIYIDIVDDVPVASANAAVQLDDDALTGGNLGGTDDDADSANTSGTLGFSFGADGAGSVQWLTSGAPTGFAYEKSGDNLLVKQGGVTVLTITMNTATGAYTVTQNAPILHAAGLDENEQAFTLTYQVTDGDGDTTTGTLAISVDDDAPTIGRNENNAPTLTVDETDLATNASAGFAGLFAGAYGADGAGATTYVLGVSAPGAASGVTDTATGQQIYLYLESGQVVGRVGSSSGAIAFVISVDASGNVTLDQQHAVMHDDPNDHDEASNPTVLSSADLVTLTATITDKDGDSATATANIGSAFAFEDDGPALTVTANAELADVTLRVELDETEGDDRENSALDPAEEANGNDDDDGDGLGQVTTSVEGDGGLLSLFALGGGYGADGSGTTSGALSFIGIPEEGLETTLSATDGGTITLFMDGDDIVGKDEDEHVVFRIEIVNLGTGENPDYQMRTTLFEAIDHGDDGNKFDSTAQLFLAEDGSVQLQYEAKREDADGDTVSGSATIDLISRSTGGEGGATVANHSFFSFGDDGPRLLDPSSTHIIGEATSVTAPLNFTPGTDGLGNVVFQIVEGSPAMDNAGNLLTYEGQQLYLYYGADQTVLIASTSTTKDGVDINNTSTTGFWIDIDPTADTYTLQTNGVIDNGTAITATNLTGVGGGNVVWKALIDVDGTNQDVMMSTSSGNTINTNASQIGISTGNSFTAGEAIRFDFVNELTASKVGADWTFSYDGTHNTTTFYKQKIAWAQSNVNITLTAILADGDTTFYGDDSGETIVPLDISDITVRDQNGNTVAIGTTTNGITLTAVDNGDTVTISGMQEGWTFEVKNDAAFSAIQIQAAADTDEFKLGFFSYGESSAGSPVGLTYDVVGTDADGDSLDGTINATLYPAAATFNGTSDNNTLTGTDGIDYLLGNDGDDILSGLGGDDVLIGGKGNDTMTGGSGADTFVWSLADKGTTAAPAGDTVTDFSAGDKLNLNDLLPDVDTANYLYVTQDGSGTTIHITDGSGPTDGTADVQTIFLAGYTGDASTILNDLIAHQQHTAS